MKILIWIGSVKEVKLEEIFLKIKLWKLEVNIKNSKILQKLENQIIEWERYVFSTFKS